MGDHLHVLQQKFLDHAALQCGICTPGMLVAAKSLLERNPNPTEMEVRYWLAGNLCRCTGYQKIVEAVLDAATEMRR
jgi:carbon-monoxide dehydrogenase small subunit